MTRSELSRRSLLQSAASAGLCAAGATLLAPRLEAGQSFQAVIPLDIGSRRELFVDDYLIEQMTNARRTLHPPVAKEVVIVCDSLWEGNTSAYYTLFQDGNRFRMYYRGAHYDVATKQAAHPEFTCYAESQDGIHWQKPKLGLFEFQGSQDNNIVWAGAGTHNFTPFKDTNPNCAPDAQYKALAGGRTEIDGKPKSCLQAYQSPDGIHWTLMQDQPVITDGAFDSQNLAFWHPQQKRYLDFHRKVREGARDIMTASSPDFLNWTPPVFLEYGDAPREHLYTNAIQPYFRAPHVLIGFPTRFQPEHQQVEPIFMTSRDGRNFRRFSQPLIPITAPQDRDGNRSNYMTWGLLQLPGQDREVSVYATEAYYTGPGSRVRRFTFRTDGFVSVQTGPSSGELITKPLRFTGRRLTINFATSGVGQLSVELRDAESGKAVRGFFMGECRPLRGDEIEQVVTWNQGSDLGALAGKPVRLRFALNNADLYALRFVD